MCLCSECQRNAHTAVQLAPIPVTTINTPRPSPNPGDYPKVQGKCPACGCSSLFLGAGGFITCAILGCSDPSAASRAVDAL